MFPRSSFCILLRLHLTISETIKLVTFLSSRLGMMYTCLDGICLKYPFQHTSHTPSVALSRCLEASFSTWFPPLIMDWADFFGARTFQSFLRAFFTFILICFLIPIFILHVWFIFSKVSFQLGCIFVSFITVVLLFKLKFCSITQAFIAVFR